ncbi:MAG: hypothetical protein CL920_05210 [Deltaproteobacteria bacterium]|nr:hypothetical protein [Deltaproteobacteria bacterium]MBU48080.1 hypothetical protein [Deltaproteobacteria bacterium]
MSCFLDLMEQFVTMPQVRFIHLDTPTKDLSVCQQVKQLHQQSLQTLILARDPEHAQQLDQLLWTFDKTSFIPHAIYPCDVSCHTIMISHEDLQVEGAQAIVLGREAPFDYVKQFSVVVDFAEVYNASLRQNSRLRFKQWKEAGFPPQYEKP